MRKREVLSWENARRALMVSAVLSVLALALIFAVSLRDESVNDFLRFSPSYLAAAGGAVVLSWGLEALRLKGLVFLLDSQVRFRRLFAISLATYFAANVTPFGSGGVPLQAYLLHKEKMPVGGALAVGSLRMLFNALFFLIAGPPFFLAAIKQSEHMAGYQWVFYVAFGMGALHVVGLVFVLFFSGSLRGFIEALLERRFVKRIVKAEKRKEILERIREEIENFQGSIELLRLVAKKRDRLLTMIGVSVLTGAFWLVFLQVPPLLLMALGLPFDWVPVIAVQIIFFFVLPYVPVPGGSGAAELGTAALFVPFVPGRYMGIFVAAWRFFSYYMNTLVGGIVFAGSLRRNESERGCEREKSA